MTPSTPTQPVRVAALYRFARIDAVLAVQQHDARWWRDASLAYDLAISGKALPDGVRTPDRSLSDYKAIQLEFVPGITK